jgi:hypothetical protein
MKFLMRCSFFFRLKCFTRFRSHNRINRANLAAGPVDDHSKTYATWRPKFNLPRHIYRRKPFVVKALVCFKAVTPNRVGIDQRRCDFLTIEPIIDALRLVADSIPLCPRKPISQRCSLAVSNGEWNLHLWIIWWRLREPRA